jgi:hypothetical protein
MAAHPLVLSRMDLPALSTTQRVSVCLVWELLISLPTNLPACLAQIMIAQNAYLTDTVSPATPPKTDT